MWRDVNSPSDFGSDRVSTLGPVGCDLAKSDPHSAFYKTQPHL